MTIMAIIMLLYIPHKLSRDFNMFSWCTFERFMKNNSNCTKKDMSTTMAWCITIWCSKTLLKGNNVTSLRPESAPSQNTDHSLQTHFLLVTSYMVNMYQDDSTAVHKYSAYHLAHRFDCVEGCPLVSTLLTPHWKSTMPFFIWHHHYSSITTDS